MSAIAGIYHSDNSSIPVEDFTKMMDNLAQFPANDLKAWTDNNIFLGCLSQWITPESIGEPLPFFDHERQLAITADAIIDNRDELFDLLQVDKAFRKTMPDSQLILLSYLKWGNESPKYLVGDFAFMIWDKRKNKLFGARDYVGYRTLYYYHQHHHFAFCTTINALLTLPYTVKQLDENWLAQYIAISGTIDTVDAASTPYRHIEQVPPAHSISLIGNKLTLSRYTSLSDRESIKLKSNEEYIEAFQEVFTKAVKSRLRTHHNIGSQLSGGLDSGAVVGFAAKALKEERKTLHTFSYIPLSNFTDFTPKQLLANESPYINSTVNYVGGIKQHYHDFNDRNSYTDIDDLMESLEMPYKYFENSFWLKGMFEKAHEQGIGVLLNGDRGNFSVSWGSAIEYYSILLKRFKWVKLLQELNCYSQTVGGARLRMLPDIAKVSFPFIKEMLPKEAIRQLTKVINLEFADRTDVYSKLKDHGIDETGWFPRLGITNERKQILEDIYPWNTGNALTCKLSLRYSLWKRDPTNDIRVVRFCLSLPEDQFVQNGMDRALIRRATEGYLPDNVRLNQRVRGVQGIDWIYRMTLEDRDSFLNELQVMVKDPIIQNYLNVQVLVSSLAKIKENFHPEQATDPNCKILMRSLILYRYLKKFN